MTKYFYKKSDIIVGKTVLDIYINQWEYDGGTHRRNTKLEFNSKLFTYHAPITQTPGDGNTYGFFRMNFTQTLLRAQTCNVMSCHRLDGTHYPGGQLAYLANPYWATYAMYGTSGKSAKIIHQYVDDCYELNDSVANLVKQKLYKKVTQMPNVLASTNVCIGYIKSNITEVCVPAVFISRIYGDSEYTRRFTEMLTEYFESLGYVVVTSPQNRFFWSSYGAHNNLRMLIQTPTVLNDIVQDENLCTFVSEPLRPQIRILQGNTRKAETMEANKTLPFRYWDIDEPSYYVPKNGDTIHVYEFLTNITPVRNDVVKVGNLESTGWIKNKYVSKKTLSSIDNPVRGAMLDKSRNEVTKCTVCGKIGYSDYVSDKMRNLFQKVSFLPDFNVYKIKSITMCTKCGDEVTFLKSKFSKVSYLNNDAYDFQSCYLGGKMVFSVYDYTGTNSIQIVLSPHCYLAAYEPNFTCASHTIPSLAKQIETNLKKSCEEQYPNIYLYGTCGKILSNIVLEKVHKFIQGLLENDEFIANTSTRLTHKEFSDMFCDIPTAAPITVVPSTDDLVDKQKMSNLIEPYIDYIDGDDVFGRIPNWLGELPYR